MSDCVKVTGAHVVSMAPMTGTMLEPNRDGDPVEVAVSVPLGVHARVFSGPRGIIEYSLDPGDNERKDLMVTGDRRGDRSSSKRRIWPTTVLVRIERYNWKHFRRDAPGKYDDYHALCHVIKFMQSGIECRVDEAIQDYLKGGGADLQAAGREASYLEVLLNMKERLEEDLDPE